MHGQYSARPTITYSVVGHHCFVTGTGTKLYRLVMEANVCEQLAWGRYLTVEQRTSHFARPLP